VADEGGGMSASCTAGPIVRYAAVSSTHTKSAANSEIVKHYSA